MPLEVLQTRAHLLHQIRDFFAKRNVLEVQTPCLVNSAPSNPGIKAFSIEHQFLHTSPEFEMKGLLAKYPDQPIYQICPVFRQEESGPLHSPEFTMIEWYRPSFSLNELIEEIIQLLNNLLGKMTFQTLTYQNLFQQTLNIDPLDTTLTKLQHSTQHLNIQGTQTFDKDDWLDALMSLHIQPWLKHNIPYCIITDYPASQAELAQANEQTAERFEVFINGIELANGYHELLDADIYLQRVQQDNQKRKKLNLSPIKPDQKLLATMQQNLPDCCGVSLGFDRVLILAMDAK